MRRVLVLLLVLSTGCSLPLSKGVHSVGEVQAPQRQVAPLDVIPPGPKAGATPVETVLGFLGAQASSDGRHAIARQYLSAQARTTWDDDVDVQVYDPDTLEVQQLGGGTTSDAVVRVAARVTALVRADGSYVARPDVMLTESYRLVRGQGGWQLAEVPDGLRLTAADRLRAFAPFPVYYLAPGVGDALPQLVPDQVFLPVGTDLARTLVSRLLRPPSQALLGSVATAVPDGSVVREVSASSSGVVTVDLGGVGSLPVGRHAQDLSAQLVWTLRSLGASFRGLRLEVQGRPLAVPGEKEVQDAGEWDTYDPQGLGPRPPYFFTSGRRLRSSIELPSSPATTGAVGDGRAVAVDEVAVTPDRTRVALLEESPSGVTTVRTGPLRGTSFGLVARVRRLTSPSWGSSRWGLWLVRDGREVVRLQNGLRHVPVAGLPSGSVSSLAVSRDGVRVALVVGGRLYVGRIELVAGSPRVVGLTQVLPALHAATRVTWESGTGLVVIGVLNRSVQVARVAVDGSSVQVLNTAGLVPRGVTASPAGVVLATANGLFLSTGGAFRQVQVLAASAPAFPG